MLRREDVDVVSLAHKVGDHQTHIDRLYARTWALLGVNVLIATAVLVLRFA